MVELIFILWVGIGTAGFWETIEGIRRIREFKMIPEWIWSLAGAVLPVLWITLIQVFLHPINILLYGVVSIIYVSIVRTRKWEIWSSLVSVAAQLGIFLWVPVWHTQMDRFWVILVAELAAILLYFLKKNSAWGLLIVFAWIFVKPLFFHTNDQMTDFIDLGVLSALLFLYTKESERRLKIVYERSHDPLTRLLNRISFNDWMLEKNGQIGLMALVDLDDFKFANDTFGHQVGDQILEEVGRRLCKMDVKMDAFRWGGDEFILLLPGIYSKEQAAPVIQKIHDEMTRDPVVGKETLKIQASIGVAMGSIDDSLLTKADSALLKIKRTGKNRIGWYTDHDEVEKERVEIASESHLKWVSDSLRYLMEHSTKGFILTNLRQQILDVNPVFEKMSGYSRGELIGKSPKMLASPLHLNQMKYPEMKETLNKLDWWRGIFINKRPNGEVWMSHDEISAVKVGDSTVGYWALVEEDELFDMEHELLYAMEREEFQVFLQPKCTADGRIVSAEALIRWLHSDKGFIPPMDFIPVAEKKGLIIPIGYWVFQEACMLCNQLQKANLHIPISVNVSPVQFHEYGFVHHLQQMIEDIGVDPTWVTLEVTEGILIDHADQAISRLHELHQLGLRVSLDDFGTGYSSLAYLKDLRLDEIKIDQSFVRSMGNNDNSQIILSSLLGMAGQLNLDVVAEGVETNAQLDFLVKKGCHIFQGYYFSQPIPSEQFVQSLISFEDPHVRVLQY